MLFVGLGDTVLNRRSLPAITMSSANTPVRAREILDFDMSLSSCIVLFLKSNMAEWTDSNRDPRRDRPVF